MIEKGSRFKHFIEQPRRLIQKGKANRERKDVIESEKRVTGIFIGMAMEEADLTAPEEIALKRRFGPQSKKDIANVEPGALSSAWDKLKKTRVGPQMEQALINVVDLVDADKVLRKTRQSEWIPWEQVKQNRSSA